MIIYCVFFLFFDISVCHLLFYWWRDITHRSLHPNFLTLSLPAFRCYHRLFPSSTDSYQHRFFKFFYIVFLILQTVRQIKLTSHVCFWARVNCNNNRVQLDSYTRRKKSTSSMHHFPIYDPIHWQSAQIVKKNSHWSIPLIKLLGWFHVFDLQQSLY